jgi:hypothetical protein
VRQGVSIAQHLLATPVKFIDKRHVLAIRELPLLHRAIDKAAFMVEVAEPFFETGLGIATNKRVQKMRSEVTVPIEQFEQLYVALRQLNALARADTAHTGTAARDFHGPSAYRSAARMKTFAMWRKEPHSAPEGRHEKGKYFSPISPEFIDLAAASRR